MILVIDILFVILMITSGIFVIDYLRTADLKFAYSRLMLALNLGLFGIMLSIVTGVSIALIGSLAFSLVVTMYQIVLLHRARRQGKKIIDLGSINKSQRNGRRP